MSIINNLPKYVTEYNYVVARVTNGELWFYGAFNSLEKAYDAVEEVNGCMFDIRNWGC